MLRYPPPQRRRKSKQPRKVKPSPPVTTGARIVAMWLEDSQTLNVQFDSPISVVGGGSTNVGTWMIQDATNGTFAPTSINEVDETTIWLITSTDMTSGTAGYTGGNPGAMASASGFPMSDSGSYPS